MGLMLVMGIRGLVFLVLGLTPTLNNGIKFLEMGMIPSSVEKSLHSQNGNNMWIKAKKGIAWY
jgi:hypothetical protein